jgi:hypothetical protein
LRAALGPIDELRAKQAADAVAKEEESAGAKPDVPARPSPPACRRAIPFQISSSDPAAVGA